MTVIEVGVVGSFEVSLEMMPLRGENTPPVLLLNHCRQCSKTHMLSLEGNPTPLFISMLPSSQPVNILGGVGISRSAF